MSLVLLIIFSTRWHTIVPELCFLVSSNWQSITNRLFTHTWRLVFSFFFKFNSWSWLPFYIAKTDDIVLYLAPIITIIPESLNFPSSENYMTFLNSFVHMYQMYSFKFVHGYEIDVKNEYSDRLRYKNQEKLLQRRHYMLKYRRRKIIL